MIQKLCDTSEYRSYLDRRTGDVIMQADPSAGFTGRYSYNGHWEVVVRGIKTPSEAPHPVDALHINHKRGVVQVLRGYTEDETETLSEAKLDGILRDFRFVQVLGGMIDASQEITHNGKSNV